MRLRRNLKPNEILLVGRLFPQPNGWRWANGRRPDPPCPMIRVWCTSCRTHHEHGFEGRETPGFRLDAVVHKVPHCEDGGPPGGYWVGLDPCPDARADHLEKLAAHARLLARWKAARGEHADRPTLAVVC